MTIRSALAWATALTLGLLACLAGVLVFSALLVARTLTTVGAKVLGDLLAGLASYLYLVAVMEVAGAAIVWATQGPILALSWVAARISAWQGQ